MRRIGRLRREASPSKVANRPGSNTTPIISGARAARRSRAFHAAPKGAEPGTTNSPAARAETLDDRPERLAGLPVRKTSSPSSSPLRSVLAAGQRPKRSVRCEIDLSPGGRNRPLSAWRALRAEGAGPAGLEDSDKFRDSGHKADHPAAPNGRCRRLSTTVAERPYRPAPEPVDQSLRNRIDTTKAGE